MNRWCFSAVAAIVLTGQFVSVGADPAPGVPAALPVTAAAPVSEPVDPDLRSGDYAFAQKDYPVAVSFYTKYLRTAEKRKDREMMRTAYVRLLDALVMGRIPALAEEYLKQYEQRFPQGYSDEIAIWRCDILYQQKKYAEAYKCYEQLFDSTMLQPDVYYQAARCQLQAGDTTAYLSLLDRCVDHFSKPYLREVAPYLLVRAEANISAANYRKAVADLNEYEKLMASQVNDKFYYIRFQAEVGGRLYQQALNDIDKAIELNGQNEFYLAEKASFQVRVGLYDEACETARECIRISPDYSDGYLFLGLAQCLKGEKAEGVKNLTRAGELGDPQAAGLIEKYSK